MKVKGVRAGGRGSHPPHPSSPQHPWKGILSDFDEDDGDGRQRWMIF